MNPIETTSTAQALPDPDDSPIFVIGTGRSGTTLLRQMLNAHPRIYISHEAFFYSYAKHTPKKYSASAWLERYFHTFSFAWMQVDPDVVRAELPDNLPRDRIAEAYRAVMRANARQHGKVRYGEKSPLDTANLAQIFGDFKNPRVIYIMRDPRATIASLNRMPFASSSIGLNSYLCARQLQHIKPFLDRILEIRLEDLADDPRTVMGEVLNFVGEPWHDAVLDHTRYAPADDVTPFPWFGGATQTQPRSENGTPAWRKQLSPAWIRIIEAMNRDGMQRYHYDPVPFAAEPSRVQPSRAQPNRTEPSWAEPSWAEPSWIDRTWTWLRDLPEAFISSSRALNMWKKTVDHFTYKGFYEPQEGMEDSLRMNRHAWRYYPDFVMPKIPQPRTQETLKVPSRAKRTV